MWRVGAEVSVAIERAVVIGGTGMLAGVTRALVEQGYDVSVVARGAHCGKGYTPIAVDYRDRAALERALVSDCTERGAPALVVCWMHARAGASPLDVGTWLATPDAAQRFVHVLGSAAARPGTDGSSRRVAFEALGYAYREVVLGFVLEHGGSRWLSHDEIVEGVIATIDADDTSRVVGVIEPWSMRP